MKNLLILAVITTLCGFSNYSFAACEPVACNTSAGNDRLNADTLEISGKARRSASRCYICEDGYCEDGDIVYNQTFSKFAVCRQSWGWIGDDRWKEYTPQHCTDETNLSNEFNRGMTGLGKYWKVNGVSHGATQATLIGATSTASGQSICYYYACQDGFTFDTQKRECVPESQVSQLPPIITQPTTPTQPVAPQPTPTQPSQPTTQPPHLFARHGVNL